MWRAGAGVMKLTDWNSGVLRINYSTMVAKMEQATDSTGRHRSVKQHFLWDGEIIALHRLFIRRMLF